MVAKIKCTHAGPQYHTEAKAIPHLFLDDSVSIEKESGGRAGKRRGQKHLTLVAANELKPVSSHTECLVTQQVPFSLTKGKKITTRSLLNKHRILSCEQIAFSMEEKIFLSDDGLQNF